MNESVLERIKYSGAELRPLRSTNLGRHVVKDNNVLSRDATLVSFAKRLNEDFLFLAS